MFNAARDKSGSALRIEADASALNYYAARDISPDEAEILVYYGRDGKKSNLVLAMDYGFVFEDSPTEEQGYLAVEYLLPPHKREDILRQLAKAEMHVVDIPGLNLVLKV